jgi:heme-degrading monooxygenase HmoA
MVRVLIERWLLPGVDKALIAALREMRRDAIHASGYISGETLQDMDDPAHYAIVSSWRSREDWDRWAGCSARKRVRGEIAPLLAKPERVSVFEPA